MVAYKYKSENKGAAIAGFARWEEGVAYEGVLRARVEGTSGSAYYVLEAIGPVTVEDRDRGEITIRKGQRYGLSERWAIADLRRYIDAGLAPTVRVAITARPSGDTRAWRADWESTLPLPDEAF